jgi:hypothetical protein
MTQCPLSLFSMSEVSLTTWGIPHFCRPLNYLAPFVVGTRFKGSEEHSLVHRQGFSTTRYSSVSTVTRLRAGRPEFDSRQGQGFPLFATVSIPALGPTQTPIQWVPGSLFPEWGVKLTNHFHLAPRLRMRGVMPPLPIRLHGVVLR